MAGKLRILVFMYNTRRGGESLGGAERRIFKFAEFAEGVETHFLERKPGIAKCYSQQPCHTAWAPKISPRLPAHLQAFIWSFSSVLSAIKLNRRFRFSLLASHDPEFWNVLPMFFAAQFIRRPTVATLHHVERMEDRGIMRSFRDFYQYFRGINYHVISSIFSATEKILSVPFLKRCHLLLAVSQTTKQDFMKRGVPEAKVSVVANGIDVSYLASFRTENKKYDIGYLGRISRRKGIDDILYVLGKMPDEKAIIIGGGHSALLKQYSSQAKSNVAFTGFLPDDEAYRLLASTRLFLFPSYEEGFGLVIGEAMALGLPVVCYDIPTLIETWGTAALFVKTGDTSALVTTTQNLLKDEAKRAEQSKRGLSFVERYDWPKVAQIEVKILKSLTEKRKVP